VLVVVEEAETLVLPVEPEAVEPVQVLMQGLELLELLILEVAEEADRMEAHLTPEAQAAQASSSLPTHNSSHLWHLLMQVLPTLTQPHHEADSVSIHSRREQGR